ncbi:sec-independent translocase [Actinoallomurus purpureus]|uniref:sec-independent translocase n=1 Tax=Actinoallomurus purpureus TaxID=478114 RepID=UPI0020932C09|nr:sec-independent translocase [Actinoallomurus purpureus]MCO6005381.1 sec-independent translocase [Actinoallomurus purpureus]
MFDIGFVKLVLLLVLALIIFGPDELPTVARKAARTLRRLRRLAEAATGEIKAGLGPEHADLNLMDLHPRRFVKKHLLDDLDGDRHPYDDRPLLPYGEHPPYDTDAT